MRYSPSTGGFYPSDVFYPNLPSDLVEITSEQHALLIGGQGAGKRIVAVNGAPVLQDVAEATATLAEWRATAKVSRFQAFAALDAVGLLDDATALVTAQGGVAKLAWDNAIEFRRSSPTINGLASAMGLTDEALDALFLAAAEIEA